MVHLKLILLIGMVNTGMSLFRSKYNPMQLAYHDDLQNVEFDHALTEQRDGNVESKVIFYLYTRKGNEEILTLEKDVLLNSSFDSTKETKIVIHGYLDNKNKPMPQTIKNNYLETDDVNIIIVDWGKIAIGINYLWIADQTQNVGNYLGQFIDFLILSGCNPKSIHLIGHSLGAHIAGFAGQSLTVGKAARITGLDPAKPDFQNRDPSKRLDQSDADFVDCIHTCGGLLGLYNPMCHADFYPNGGRNIQPGCHFFDFGRCSHIRSYLYFAESILPNHVFTSLECSWSSRPENCTESDVKMGNFVSTRAHGVFFVHTNKEAPYAQVQNSTRQ